MSNIGDVRKTFGGTYGLDHETAFDQMTDFTKDFRKSAADSMAADATTVQKFWQNPFDFSIRIVRAICSGDAGLTAHDTNYAQITLQTDDAANGAPVVACMWQTTLTTVGGVIGTGTWTTDVQQVAQLVGTGITVAAATFIAGANLFLAIAKQGAGVVVPISSYIAQLRRV